jgi:hypothetical protein
MMRTARYMSIGRGDSNEALARQLAEKMGVD